MKSSLLRRMILAQGLVLVFVWCLTTVLGLWTMYVSRKGTFDDTLDIVSSALVALLQDETDTARLRTMAQRVEQLDATFTRKAHLRPGEYHPIYQVMNASGTMLYRSANAPTAPLLDSASGYQNVMLGNQALRARVREDAAGRVRVIVAIPQALMRTVFWRSFRSSPIQFVILFAALALITWPMARYALRPLRRLAASVDSRNPWDVSPLQDPPRLRETDPLVGALERLFGRIRGLLEAQRRFIADAASELRTPLAVVGEQARFLQAARDPYEREQAGAHLQQGVERAARVVGQLLALARLETAEPPPAGAVLDVAGLIQERLGAVLGHALGKEQDLGYEGPAFLHVPASSAILIHAFDNLLDNAIRHTPVGGRITFRARRAESSAILEIEDSGPGIPETRHGSVFERFNRQESAAQEGAGLGLAIVQQAVRLHGGTVVLSPGNHGAGLRVTLRLPLPEGTATEEAC